MSISVCQIRVAPAACILLLSGTVGSATAATVVDARSAGALDAGAAAGEYGAPASHDVHGELFTASRSAGATQPGCNPGLDTAEVDEWSLSGLGAVLAAGVPVANGAGVTTGAMGLSLPRTLVCGGHLVAGAAQPRTVPLYLFAAALLGLALISRTRRVA